MRRHRTVIIIALMGIIPIIAAIFAIRLFLPVSGPEQGEIASPAPAESALPPAVEEPTLRMVLAAARDLRVGTLLGEEYWTELGIDEGLVRRGHIALDDLEDVEKPYGYVVREAVESGAPLTWHALVGPGQRGFLSAVLQPGMRAITVRVGAGTRHSGLIDPGDRVDVLLTANSRGGDLQNVLSRTILEDVRVLAVDHRIETVVGSSRGAEQVERTEIVTATLEVRPSQTGLLALGEFEGDLALAVRPLAAADVHSEAGGTVDLHNLLGSSAEPPGEPEPELRTTVRVIRGTQVTGETFDGDIRSAAIEDARVESVQ